MIMHRSGADSDKELGGVLAVKAPAGGSSSSTGRAAARHRSAAGSPRTSDCGRSGSDQFDVPKSRPTLSSTKSTLNDSRSAGVKRASTDRQIHKDDPLSQA